jgi:NTE family protein
MHSLEPHNLIGASPLFRHMPPQEAEAIVARLQPVQFACEERILEQGIWHGRLYVVQAGQVSVILQDQNQDQDAHHTAYVVATLGPGECFGEMSLLTGEPPNATVRANCDATLWSLSQADFIALMALCPTLLRNINAILSQRLTRANQYLLAQQMAEIVLLTQIEAPAAPIERNLSYQIADALARCSRQRVLLLELCAQEEASGPHFAVQSRQLRPTLLACLNDRTRLQEHRAPLSTGDEPNVLAVAALAETREGLAALTNFNVLPMLNELASYYDYMLLTIYRQPSPSLQAMLQQLSASQRIKRRVMLLSAAALAGALENKGTLDLFITHVTERPTIGLQDRYAQLAGQAIKRLLPVDDALLQESWQQRQALAQLAPEAALSKAVQFVARHIARQTVGIAFGGGGARGFAHVGVLAGLLEHGVPLDYISSCSIGTLAPGMYLMGKSLEEIEQAFLQIQQGIVQWRFPRTSVFSNRGIRMMLRSLCGDICFEDLETPFAVVAADLSTRSGVVMERGPLWLAGLASVSLPGIFPPVMIGDHILVDAGMHDPVPIRLIRQMGANILLASELGEQEPPALTSATTWLQQTEGRPRAPHIVDTLLRSYDLAMATVGMHSIREADVVIRPRLHRVSLRQFSEGRKFILAGREAVEQMLPALRQRLPWL